MQNAESTTRFCILPSAFCIRRQRRTLAKLNAVIASPPSILEHGSYFEDDSFA
jgi:hypothetical protein